jgi:acetylornithine deacetylase/succinyl-diaminopimelate desuccinylase family protein
MVNDAISLLADLVKIPSVCGEEREIADFILKWLQENNVPAELLEVKPNRPDVIARLKAPSPGPRILLNGHMDTVKVGDGWTRDPFGAEIEDGKMYGRGTQDMKAGLAAILWTAAACREEGLPKRGELIVAAVIDEEAHDWGTYGLIQKGLTEGLDFAMISEPTDLNVITAHKGRTMFEIEVHGKSAHSHWPEHGINAIEKGALLINALPRISGPTHPRLGRPTVNTLKIEGGQEEVMLVPENCRIVIDRCLVPGYDSQTALGDLKRLISDVGINADARLAPRDTPYCDPFEIPDSNPNISRIAGAAAKVLGRTPKIDAHFGPCDSCILVNQGGIPTIEFGPSGGKLHESDEYVTIDSTRKTADVYREVIRTYMS